MKITFFIGSMSKGGAERQLVYIANGLVKKGHRVTILTMREGNAYLDLLDKNVLIESLGVTGAVDAFRKSLKFLIKKRPDVLVCFLYYASLIGRAVGLFLRLKVISSYRNISYGSKSRDLLVKWTSLLEDKTLSNVRSARDKLLPQCLWSEMEVIPNIYSYSEVKRGDIILPAPNGFRWCYIGRLGKQKNLYQLVLAFKDFSEKIPGECQLLLLGEGEERTTLEEKVADLGLGGKVFFLGHSYFVNSVLDTCDAFILPSRWEGMPNALMEAMASKLPSVVTPVGAVPEMIADGKSGFISKGFDAVSLSAAMIKLFHVGDSERTAMGVEANRYIEENCSESAVMYMWENVLSDAIK